MQCFVVNELINGEELLYLYTKWHPSIMASHMSWPSIFADITRHEDGACIAHVNKSFQWGSNYARGLVVLNEINKDMIAHLKWGIVVIANSLIYVIPKKWYFLDDLSHWLVSVNLKKIEKKCPCLLLPSIHWMWHFAMSFTPDIPYLTCGSCIA